MSCWSSVLAVLVPCMITIRLTRMYFGIAGLPSATCSGAGCAFDPEQSPLGPFDPAGPSWEIGIYVFALFLALSAILRRCDDHETRQLSHIPMRPSLLHRHLEPLPEVPYIQAPSAPPPAYGVWRVQSPSGARPVPSAPALEMLPV
ncbi:unnamed protein product [Vitrella brassicaformis CCMP3155]|uniref:Uncharacterized protein n=1 Tax=Vitrella brassicaformis (strain CCMP3155) TaxID=1169540 RepID=A0A0G4GYR3_VITBC|nr:unnamed protein product [Vitrella brassicaformis CCMP3155]|eukprot:CEM36055.1 unnamed protein product [Vitrella brassicaformis CCMP3155]